MKVSKVVLLVVALHVLVIGGIFVFEGCSRAKAPAPDFAANETSPSDTAYQPALPPDPNTQNLMPPAPPAQPIATAPMAPAPVTTKTYTVKAGDSLWKISKTEGISVGELAQANNLTKSSVLKVGQKLTIPTKTAPATMTATSASGATPGTGGPAPESSIPAATPVGSAAAPGYTVKAGDSLWKIAKAQGVSVAALKQANALSSDALKVGQKLVIPARAEPVTTVAGATASAVSEWTPGPVQENGQMFHIVDIGESPASIAKKHGIKVEDLMRANNINDARRIRVGDRLTIPVTSPSASAPPAVPAAPAVATPFVSSMN